ncbi:MAG: protein-disulfide reductase DsbD domain-containing protein [Pyrinomonadaceae bacterium]
MLKNIYRLIFLSAIFFAVSICAVNAQTVTGSIGNGTFTPGKAVRATVVLSLPGGLHANSRYPGSEYAVPTTVRVSGSGVRIGAVSYPRGHNRKFEFSSDTINVYEGRTAFNFNVTVPSTYRGNSIRINVTVKYQACTNEVCYPPKSKQITLTARAQ